MAEMRQRKLVLETGAEFVGTGFGSMNDALCEIVFNTSMVGYQEVVTDPNHTAQTVLMTYPLIGNYGINDEDSENRVPTLGGIVVREYCDEPSNFRYTKTLSEFLEESDIPGLQDVDTRAISRIIRDHGSMRSFICDADLPHEEAMARILAYELPHDSVARVSCKKKSYARTPNPRYSVVAIDCGMKQSLIRKLNAMGCNVTIVPYNTPACEIMSFKPDGLFLSNGPGNPADATPVIETVRALRGQLPIFGVCMGCQVLALACGGRVIKLKCGHHGSNLPVRILQTGRLDMSRQNHSYCVEETSLAQTGLTVTHRNVMDESVEGVACMAEKMFGIQYDPVDDKLYEQFIRMMEEGKRNA